MLLPANTDPPPFTGAALLVIKVVLAREGLFTGPVKVLV